MMDYILNKRCIRHIVIGSGAAGFNAAARLHQFGETEVALITEGINCGTSRNTGSDKQTYYKLSLAGEDADSVLRLAEDLFAGQCVDGDQALCEAALSVQSFYHLVELGVPFPCTEYAEYIGYKTDHDRGRRATSVGPYTSKVMTEKLEADVRRRGIEILDGFLAVRIVAKEGRLKGVLCLDKKETAARQKPVYLYIKCQNAVLATGGPAGIYHDSVYPVSQTGSSGIAFEAGVKGKNLTEWQYGLASISPRWNVSGTYMQVLPKVISTDADGGNAREFLYDYFDDPYEMLSLLFLKGYQWPFDTAKIFGGSSMIDLLVYEEHCLKGRKIFLDFRANSRDREIEFEKLSSEAYEYLRNAGACFGTPIERLAHMNQPAIDFYLEHGVDLRSEMLEVAVCAQHNNGGLETDANWETCVKGLYAAGEVCGSHGVTRPGGSALNAGQVGSYRAASHIAFGAKEENSVRDAGPGIVYAADAGQNGIACQNAGECCCDSKTAADIFEEKIIAECIGMPERCSGTLGIDEMFTDAAVRMSTYAGMIRSRDGLKKALEETLNDLARLPEKLKKPEARELGRYYHLRDMLMSQVVYISAMLHYAEEGCGSRGSGLYTDFTGEKPGEKMPELFTCRQDNGANSGRVQEAELLANGSVKLSWRHVRPIPETDYFFENQWRAYRKRMKLQ